MPVLPRNPFWVSCDETYDGRSGKVWSLEGERSYVRKFKVVVKDKYLGAIGVCLCPALPMPASAYHQPNPNGGPPLEFDLLALMLSMSAEQQDSGDWGVWIVTCEYGTNIPSGNRPENLASSAAQANANNPESQIADISWDFETVNEAYPRDLNGQAYLDTAYVPLSPAPTRPVDYPVLRITRNELTYNYAKASYYSRSVNKQKFLGAPPGIVQCLPPKSSQANRGNLRYWRTSYQLRFRALQLDGTYILPKINVIVPLVDKDGVFLGWLFRDGANDHQDGWQPLKQMAGTYRLGKFGKDILIAVGKLIPILNMGGQQVSKPVLLDENGQQSVPANPLVNPEPKAWYKQFIEYRETDLHKLLVSGLS